jgi:hypothetical protein
MSEFGAKVVNYLVMLNLFQYLLMLIVESGIGLPYTWLNNLHTHCNFSYIWCMKIWEYVGARLAYRGIIKGYAGAQKAGLITLTNVFLILLVVFVVIAFALYQLGRMERGNSEEVWGKVEIGDSLFVQDYGMITFYKKGRTKLAGNVQRKLKYARIDTADYIAQNYIRDRFFYSEGSSFIGICRGVDSAVTGEGSSSGNKWLIILPANSFLDFKPSDDYSTFHWKDKSSDLLSTVPLSNQS